MALTPGSFAAAFAYRRELSRDRAALRVLLPPAFAGGLVGSVLLLKTPESAFDTPRRRPSRRAHGTATVRERSRNLGMRAMTAP